MTDKQYRGLVVMMVGIPASGKSTWISQNRKPSWNVISPDQFLEEKYDYEWTPERASEAWARSFQRYGQYLLDGGTVVWDATFLSPIIRASVLHIGKGAGFKTQAIFFDIDIDVCIQRNSKRFREPVPEQTIRRMHAALIPPTVEEGFDQVTIHQDDLDISNSISSDS